MTRASAMKAASSLILSFLLFCFRFSSISSEPADPTPAPWPYQFRALLFKNNSGGLQVVDFWYDWSKSGSYGIIQNQLGLLTHERAFESGISYIYRLDSGPPCRILHFPVGILRPNWLEGAIYRGQQSVDGFLCNVWEKVGWIWYYEDVLTKRPVFWSWILDPGFTAHVISFEVGAVLEDADQWKVPAYCFETAEKKRPLFESSVEGVLGA